MILLRRSFGKCFDGSRRRSGATLLTKFVNLLLWKPLFHTIHASINQSLAREYCWTRDAEFSTAQTPSPSHQTRTKMIGKIFMCNRHAAEFNRTRYSSHIRIQFKRYYIRRGAFLTPFFILDLHKGEIFGEVWKSLINAVSNWSFCP